MAVEKQAKEQIAGGLIVSECRPNQGGCNFCIASRAHFLIWSAHPSCTLHVRVCAGCASELARRIKGK